MSRPPRGRIPPARRRRAVTAEEEALWRAFVARAGIVPIRPEEAAATDPTTERVGEPAPAASPPPQRAVPPLPPPLPDLSPTVMPAGLDRRRWEDLRRGRLRPERTLDLHGKRAAEAHAEVRAFVLAAHAAGLRCIAIVTGKGAGEAGGVLRRELPHWLNAPELRGLILALAHPQGGNVGAVHLLLRRRRV
ncbi:Smr/MutS family protein [Elioraea thermophila]|uniref:Smr/MutS family protein n=1 Tax=Elioraea thermophila TaxID=2185104 RepID=UPI000DF17F60|nr:Smr/MutS family protein [Elioraea thermophila]